MTEEETGRKLPLSPLVLSLVILGILASAAFIYWQINRGFEEPPATTTAPPPAPAPPPPPVDPDLPPLEESDPYVRAALEALSEHPRFAAWLLSDELTQRFVASVDNVARGKSPRDHLEFLQPQGRFQADEADGELLIADTSYARYNRFTEVFLSLDTTAGVRLYRRLEPLFQDSYQELGYPEGEFEATLARAIDHVLATPIPDGDVALEQRITGFHFQNPRLQNLSEAQKHYLRLGPENMRQVHAKLRLIQTALGLTQAQLENRGE